MPMPEGMPEKDVPDKGEISRRSAIRLGAKVAAGMSLAVATTAWVKPAIASVQLNHPGCSASPPPGTPSVDVSNTADLVKRVDRDITVKGTITIRNVSSVQAIVEGIQDTLQYREGKKWKDAPTTLTSLSQCGRGSCVAVHQRCESKYSASARVPLSASKFRNRVDVKIMYRDKIFSDAAEVEQHLVQLPGGQPTPIELPSP
jgi:hypothetical protein